MHKEWKSQLYAVFSEYLDQASQTIHRVLRHPWLLESPRAEHVRKAHEELVSLKEEAPTISDQKISELLTAMNAEILPIVHTHTQLVISSYFAGHPPFKTIKSREDFPDAFIFACAIDLSKKLKTHLFYISADKKLNDAISKNKNITIFKDITEFVQSEIIKKEVSRIEEERHWQEILIKIRPLLPNMAEKIKETLKREEPYLEQLKFSDVAHHAIPDDRGYAVIEGVYEPERIEFDWENVNDFGIGSISLPVSFECVADLLIDVFRGDVFSVPEGVRVMFGDFEKDVYFEASAQVNLYVERVAELP